MRVQFGGFTLDSLTRELFRGAEPIRVSPKAFELLLALVEARPKAIAKADLHERLWSSTFVSETNLAGLVTELRAALQDDPRDSKFVRTVYGYGYSFCAPTEDELRSKNHVEKSGVSPASSRPIFSRIGRWASAVVLLAAILTFSLALPSIRRAPQPTTVRFSVGAPSHTSMVSGAVLSPDGGRLAIVALDDAVNKSMIWIRALDSVTPRPLKGTEGASLPFWSPDSRFLGFFADGKLKKINAAGGQAQILTEALDGRGGTWNRADVIIFAPNTDTALFRVSAKGGPAVAVTALGKEASHRWPHFLPDGRHFFFLVLRDQRDESEVLIGSLESRQTTRLLTAYSSIAYTPPGYVLFVRDGTLVAQPFDLATMRLTGEIAPIADGVGRFGENGPTAFAAFSASESGVLSHGPVFAPPTRLGWFARSGKFLDWATPPGMFFQPSLSPDQKRVALVCTDRKTTATDICMLDVATRTISRFTFDRSPNAGPVWTPDGTHVMFGALHDGRWGFYRKAASGAGGEDLVFQPDGDQTYIGGTTGRSSEHLTIVETSTPKRNRDLWLVPLSGNASAVPFLQTKFDETHADLSPDGHWIAYASDESGTMEVYVRPFPGGPGKWQLSQGGGDVPHWRRDGRELFYVTAGKRFVAVPIEMKGEFQPGAPSTLFDVPKSNDDYAVAADGQRFLITVTVDDALQSSTTVVLNWAAGLRH